MRNAFIFINCLIASAFISVVSHELVHVLLYQKVHFIGFVFNEGAVARVCGYQPLVESQEPLAVTVGFVVGIGFLLLSNFVIYRKVKNV